MKINGINGSLPLHMAKAYGIAPTLAPGKLPPQTAPLGSLSQIARPQQIDIFQPSSSQPISAAQQLVAGRVSQSVNFDASATSTSASRTIGVNQVLQMYTRAADKVEAAVAVQIGRAIDVKG